MKDTVFLVEPAVHGHGRGAASPEKISLPQHSPPVKKQRLPNTGTNSGIFSLPISVPFVYQGFTGAM